MKLEINPFDSQSVDTAIKEVQRYQEWVQRKESQLRLRLATLGVSVASLEFRRAIYNGSNDVTVRVDDDGSTATIIAEGSAVLFIEFGSGLKYGGGHPEAGDFGYGPGTYSDGPNGKGHWDNPKGWYYGSGQHTYGNPPARAMLDARDIMVERFTQIAREVFRD